MSMKHRNSHFAIGYWSRIRGARPAPDQADIDPKALKRLLPFVFLLDARSPDSLIFRLAGTTLCQRYGGELRGRNFLSHWDPDSRTQLTGLLKRSLSEGLPACVTSIGATEDCGMVEIETVLMPITFGANARERFLGVAQILTDVAPLSGRHITFERLVSAKLVREGENVQSIEPPSLPPPSERTRPRVPHLRLVASNPRIADPLRCVAQDTITGVFASLGEAAARF
jgi:hypothetical protein